MTRNAIDFVLLVVVLVGGALAWQAAHERTRLAAFHRRLVAAAGELPSDDPTLIYLKALDTGDPLHFAWRVHFPANTNLDVRTGPGSGFSGGWSCLKPTDCIVRVRMRETEQGTIETYARFVESSCRSSIDSPKRAQLLREHARDLEIEQLGKPGTAALDPKAKKPMVLLRAKLPKPVWDKVPAEFRAQFSQDLMDVTIGPPGSLP